LSEGKPFDNSIRVKATLVSGKLLEERGFQEIDEMSKDMATHISSLDSCLVKYAERAVASVSKNPGARERALKIVQLLGKEDPKEKDGEDDDGSEPEYIDPWATSKIF
jgi:hypothetical protein